MKLLVSPVSRVGWNRFGDCPNRALRGMLEPMVLFKARSSARDKTSDDARVAALVRQIQDVRSGMMKERRGLERRYSDFVGQASQLVDTGYEGERDDAAEQRLTKVESDALYARKRLSDLDRHLESLDALTERVKVMFDPIDEIERLRKR
ncbi:MAG: hypothetical protein ACE37E_15870 [Hyphomicrobiales bacterium]